MQKDILKSILDPESKQYCVKDGTAITLEFHTPFNVLDGDYTVTETKAGRGRGGSRLLKIAAVADPQMVIDTLQVDGEPKALGTPTSEYFKCVVVDGVRYEGENIQTPAPSNLKRPASGFYQRSDQREKAEARVANAAVSKSQIATNALQKILSENPNAHILLGTHNKIHPLNGEWCVENSVVEGNAMVLSLRGLNNTNLVAEFDVQRDIGLIDRIDTIRYS